MFQKGRTITKNLEGYWTNQSIIFKADQSHFLLPAEPVKGCRWVTQYYYRLKNASDAGFSRLMCEIVAIHLHCKIGKARGAVYLSGLPAAGIDRPTLGIYAVLSFSLPSCSCIFTWIYPSSMPACFGANNMGAWTLYDKHLPGRQVKNNKWTAIVPPIS